MIALQLFRHANDIQATSLLSENWGKEQEWSGYGLITTFFQKKKKPVK